MPDDKHHDSSHHDESDEPLGPMTPDDETPAGDAPEVHDDITPMTCPRRPSYSRSMRIRVGASAARTTAVPGCS